jgi:hypothetical protein
MGDKSMFICSVRASTIKFFSAVALSLALLITLLALVEPAAVATGSEMQTPTVSFYGIKTNEDRIAFLSSLGWSVVDTPQSEKTFIMPESFDIVMQGYNELQRSQGFDLSKYRKKKLTRYTYEITNYDSTEGKVYANVIVYRNRVVGGDICSSEPDGFVHALVRDR